MTTWKLCVPTYGRKEPKILEMLKKDKSLEIDFFVRGEDYDRGFYDELKRKKRVKVHSLGRGLHELGETRQRILEWCQSYDVRYCCMFDDGIVDVVDEMIPQLTISEVFEHCIHLMQTDKLHDNIVGWSFHKRNGIYADGSTCKWNDDHVKQERYFLTMPAQALIIDVAMTTFHKIEYKSLDEVGFEDCAFFADCVKEGLIFGARKYIKIDGAVPNEKKVGGSHVASEDIELKYDEQNKRCLEYIGNMMGVYVEKRYRSFAKGLMSYIIFDTDYYREVLCEKPKENAQIIKSKFIF